MLEEFSQDSFYKACNEFFQDRYRPIVRLKGTPEPPKEDFEEFQTFFDSLSSFRFQNICLMEKVWRARKDSTLQMSWVWFQENSDTICTTYISQRYGDIRTAMRQTGTFGTLFGRFKEDFAERRAQFMEELEMSVPERPTGIAKRGRSPQSHGGVANLLKVLTKTMHEQGSGIETIAKVQYTVCMQAGIYIPDEFLADVLV
ncbi:MAG: hypothetical protein VB053_03365, partial [Oscillibacter ruminantium]|uniref:hypothetical protein n=1 Tax=Oscillibacter ruminantium TaxID=1263547 RepID=UPI002B209543